MNGFFEKYGQTLIVVASLIVAVFAMAAFTHTSTDTVHKRLDAHERHIDQRFEAMEQRFNQRFDAVDRRFDRLTDEVSDLRQLIVDLGQRVSRNEGEIDVIRGHLQIADTPAP
ncbi:MAG: hypothetical protein OXP66_13180 [Candidatus Tectomicrobia bacterium]|nr:hypothetical protein [Candidatus Tectomicrobia bacterium]